MKKELKDNFLSLIRDYFVIYLPKQKKYTQYTISSYREAINLFIKYVCESCNIDIIDIEFKIITYEVVSNFTEWLKKRGNGDATINQRLSAIRSFYKYASVMDITKAVYRNEICKVPLVKHNTAIRNINHWEKEHIRLLLSIPDIESKKGLRDLTIMTLLYDGALRSGELQKLKIKDINISRENSYISVLGKGNKYRNVPISEKTVKILNKYFQIYHQNLSFDDYLIYTVIHGNKNMMSNDNLNYILKKYMKKAVKIDVTIPKKITSHTFRHSRALHLYQGGMPLPLISQWLGHEDTKTTLIYAYADTEMKRKAIEKADLVKGGDNEEFDLLKDNESREEIIKKLYGLK